jgi:hypothetical protein
VLPLPRGDPYSPSAEGFLPAEQMRDALDTTIEHLREVRRLLGQS